jgi:hypothetical protein
MRYCNYIPHHLTWFVLPLLSVVVIINLSVIPSLITPLAQAAPAPAPLNAAGVGGPRYDMGNPSYTDIWVSPTGNDDTGNGSQGSPFRTIRAAYRAVPIDSNNYRDRAYRIALLPGDYPGNFLDMLGDRPNYGTPSTPILIESADVNNRARVIYYDQTANPWVQTNQLTIYRASYVYLRNFEIRMDTAALIGQSDNAGDAFQCEQCDHVLLRNMTIRSIRRNAQTETVKLNQSSYIYVEDSDISGAGDNAIDAVSLFHGWFVRNRIYNAVDWCAYLKGGAVDFLVGYNEFFDCGTGGFTAGQGTGFQFMRAPFIHYEAYNIKVVNNLVHDVQGAGIGVNGGYNILIAYNTVYRVGNDQRNHLLEFVPGRRGCDGGAVADCQPLLTAGGWGTVSAQEEQFIPNRNIFVYNNVFYNPTFTTTINVLQVRQPVTVPTGYVISGTITYSDENLVLKGNLFWTGNVTDTLLGAGDADQGCQQAYNPTCYPAQLYADNAINTVEPQFVNFALGDVRPVLGGNLTTFTYTQSIPDFNRLGLPAPITASTDLGSLTNTVASDYLGATRASNTPPGAYFAAVGPQQYVFLPLVVR